MERIIYIFGQTGAADMTVKLLKNQAKLYRNCAVLAAIAGIYIWAQNKTNRELKKKVDELQKELQKVQAKDEE